MPYDPPYFRQARLKIERAKEHMLEFDTYASKVFGRDLAPYSVTSECDAETGEYLVRFSAVEEIKNRFAIICGDVVQNLKTALDFAWYELTASDDPGPKLRIKFPIYQTRKQLEDFIDSRPQDSLSSPSAGNF